MPLSGKEATEIEHEDKSVEDINIVQPGETIDAKTHAQDLHVPAAKGPGAAQTKLERLSDLMTIFAAGAALISDGYQNNILTLLNVVFQRLYGTGKHGYNSSVSTRVSNALLVGAILGQVGTGVICDVVGRKTAIVMATLLIVVGAALCTAAAPSTPLDSPHVVHGLFWFLTVARGVVGVGVGAEYPASSASASEAANEKLGVQRRGTAFILVTNLPLSFGGPLAVSIFLIVLSAAGENHLQTIWRVCFGIGILFPLSVLYFRLRMLNSKLYRKGAIKHNVPYWLTLKYYWRDLIGTCGAWFLYDFVTFPNGVFSGTIISSVVKDHNLRRTAEWQLLLGSIALPGVIIGAILLNTRLGRKGTMMLGFSGYLVFGLTIGLSYDRITKIVPLFVVFYGLMQSCGNLGPGDMLGLTSSESYATPVRGTLYGLSAAIGKTGAAVGTAAFKPIQNNLGKRWTFIIAAIIGVTGVIVTYFFIRDLSGVDLADEDAKFQAYLTASGWTGSVGADGFERHVVPGTIEQEGAIERQRSETSDENEKSVNV